MNRQRGPRVTKWQQSFGRNVVTITLRRFRAAKPRKSTGRQLTFSVPGRYRQITLQYRHQVARKKKQSSKGSGRLQFALPLIIVFISGLGVGATAMDLFTQRSLEPIRLAASSVPKPIIVPKTLTLPASQPTHLTVPSVGIDVDITPVGQASDGSIEMPPILDWTTGWYKYSPTPGQLGPAIIVGHVDTYKGISVFWRLRDVQPGDKITINRADNRTATFTVTSIQQFEQATFPTTAVYGNLPYAGLRLITCGGSFDTQTGSYTQNTVVYAQLTSS